MKVGDRVRRAHHYDGTPLAGKPEGPVLTVAEVRDHEPCDGTRARGALIRLSDGGWDFAWNLRREED